MAVVIIDEISDVEDVASLMHYLAQALASGNTDHLVEAGTFTLTRGPQPTIGHVADIVRLDQHDEVCEVAWHRENCSCVADAAATDPRQGTLTEGRRHDGPVSYVPCVLRGQHEWVMDCWMCWSDVQRGVVDIKDACMQQGVGR